MGNTYTVNDALTLAKKLAKGVPFTGVDTSIADIVNSTIYRAYPWRDTLKTLTSVSLSDGNQDFTVGDSDIMRVTQFSIAQTDTSPVKVRDIKVAKNLYVDLIPKSPNAVRAASYQAGVNKFRLESAVQISGTNSFELRGEYQPHPTKISDVQDTFWFEDELLEVFAKGLVYWAYRIADDERAGAMTTQDGRASYTGALGEFMQAIQTMAGDEDFGNLDGYYPDEPIATVDGRRYYSTDIYPIQ